MMANNGEIMLDPGAQSPVLQDQLLKLREFDSFVASFEKNGSQRDLSNGNETVPSVKDEFVMNTTNGNMSNSLSGNQDLTREDPLFQQKPKKIVIDDDVGGLMGLVSISPANSPVKKVQNSTHDAHQSSSATTFDDRTSSSSLGKETFETNANNSETLDSFGTTPFSPSTVLVQSVLKSRSSSNVSQTDDLSQFDPHAPVRSPTTVTKQSWVQFEEENNDDKMSTSSRGTSMSSSSIKHLYQGMQFSSSFGQTSVTPTIVQTSNTGISSPPESRYVKDWVKSGDNSPQFASNAQSGVQNSGGSIHSSVYSTDVLPDDTADQQSDITASASALSSHGGSFSGSHDNISHEYMPLESPKNMPAAIPEGWVKFDETTPTSPTKAKIYFVGSTKPGHTRSQSAGGPLDNIVENDNNRRRVSSSAMASHLHSQLEELQSPTEHSKTPSDQAATPPLPLQNKENNLFQDSSLFQQPSNADTSRDHQHVILPDHSPNVQAKNENNLQQQLQHQQQQLLIQQHQLQRQKLAAVGRQLQQIQEQQQVVYTTQTDSQSSPSQDSVLSQSPIGVGNPFKEELLLRQQQQAMVAKNSPVSDINLTPRSATSSPFNPFKLNNHNSNGSDSGIVSASSTWETFDESRKNSQLAGSRGNPFKQMIVTANVHPRDDSNKFHKLLKEPKFVDVLGKKDPKHQNPNVPHSYSSSPPSSVPHTPQKETPKVLNNQTSAASNATLQAVPFQQQVDNLTGSGVRSAKPSTSSQQEGEEPNASFVDEYPRDKADPTEGWSLMLRCPDKKKLTSSRYWKPVHVRLIDGNVIQLFDDRTRKEPFRELPLQSNYEFGDRRLQAHDTRGKIHTIKIFYVSYKEKKRFSTMEMQEKILNMEPLIKLGSTSHNVFKSFIYSVNEALMKLTAFRDRGRHYEQDQMTITVCDDFRAYIDYAGEVVKQSTTVDVSVLAFLSGMPACAIGLNDSQRKNEEKVVSRKDIVPNKTDEWIKLEHLVLHKCANKNVFTESRFIEFSPLDGCQFKLLQFKTKPKSKELPMYVKVKVTGENNHIDMRADLYIEARNSKQNLHHYFCEDIMVRVPLPEAWIRYFRKEKRIKGFSSIKSVTKKADQIKAGNKPKLIEVSTGSAKYEHAYKAVVWRIDRLPEKTTSVAITHIMRVQLNLNSMKELPETFDRNAEVEFTMPHTTASKTTVRSLAVATDTSPDKRVRYTAMYEYQVEIEKSFDLMTDDKTSDCVVQ